MKAIIFDFDGTIADSFDMFIEVMMVLLRRTQPLTAAQIEDLRQSSTREVIKKLGIKPWQIPRLMLKGRREMSARMERVQAFDGLPEALRELSSQYSLYILSTNSEENIATFLKKYQLGNNIDRIYGNIGLMGKAKGLKKLPQQASLDRADCVYVGDETRDIEAARQAGMSCIAVGWGYNGAEALRSFAPDALAETPGALLEIIRGLK
ncbi:MAG TPA: HAD-IA family hydrolase [Candidatus Saccharimonadia bacterium]|nr:HAD-IA family hydrolase [Candidatus Saccharimonadia bacterium]